MKDIQASKDWYRTFKISIPAGGKYSIKKYARYLTVLTNDNANYEPVLSIDNQAGGEMPAGIGIELPFEYFKNIDIINPDPVNAMNLFLALSNGIITDNRSVISGTVTVTDGGTPLQVTDGGTPILVDDPELQNIRNSIRENGTQEFGRFFLSPKTSLENASYAEVNNATQTVVTAAANLNGVHIRYAEINGFHHNYSAYVTAGGNKILYAHPGGTTVLANIFHSTRDFIIKPNVDLIIHSSNTPITTFIWYEVL